MQLNFLSFPRGALLSVARAFCALAFAAAACGAQAALWSTFGGNAQHTGISSVATQSLAEVRWFTPVDLARPASGFILIHYGSPVITPANTVIIPVKTGTPNGFRLDARKGRDGALLWTAATDYLLPAHNWVPSYSPVLTAGGRVWFAGAGGTVYFRDNLDAVVPTTSGQRAFYGLAAYQLDPASFNATVFINTPITADSNGNIYFGFRTTAGAPLGLASGIARIDAAGNGSWVAATTISGNAGTTQVPHQAAPALSNDESTLYVVASGPTSYLVGLDPATLAVKESSPGVPMRVALKDPRNGGAANATISDNSSASPMVGPDGDVYYGILGNPFNGSRGWLLHFSGDLVQTKTPGAFGWDNTAAVVPASAVPSYTGTSSYLVFSKYNDYPGFDGGQGVNRIAVLDPNDTMVEPHASSNGQLVMKVILAIAGPTPDPAYIANYPNAVKEWCVNAAAVDPITKAVFANNEDGKVYRWDLTTNTLAQTVTLSPGIGEAYTTTLIGPDGTVYATNWAILNAVGAPTETVTVERKGSGNGTVGSSPDGIACGLECSTKFASGEPVTLSAAPQAGSMFTGWLGGGCTGMGSCVLMPQADTTVTATFAPDTLAPLRIDIDANDKYGPLTDGLLAIRYMFALEGPQLTVNAIGSMATRSDPGDVLTFLSDIRPVLDIDGNGLVTPLTDGLLLVRHLFGLRGDALIIGGVIGQGATRTTAEQIDTYIQSLKPLP